jgi:hypothetical protein
MRVVAAIVLACACGGSKPEPAPIKVPPPANPLTPQTACARFDALVAEQCGTFANMNVTSAQCPAVFQMALAAPDTADGKVLTAMGQCMIDHPTCHGVLLCLATIEVASPTEDLRACTDPPDSRAVGIEPAAWQTRNGAGVTSFASAVSSKAHPIETCGIPAGLDWLVAAACTDGSHPIGSRQAAEAARVANVGPGGTCNSIIDLYRVTCPEAVYDVYVDGYVCPLP